MVQAFDGAVLHHLDYHMSEGITISDLMGCICQYYVTVSRKASRTPVVDYLKYRTNEDDISDAHFELVSEMQNLLQECIFNQSMRKWDLSLSRRQPQQLLRSQ